MENTSTERIKGLARAQKELFRSGATLEPERRKENLRALGAALRKWEKPLSDAFTHHRSVVISMTWPDLPFRYMPYRFFSLTKKLL